MPPLPPWLTTRSTLCVRNSVSWLPSTVANGATRTYAKQMPPRKTIEDSEIEESFLKGSGPGGQKINKTNSAVQLKHLQSGIVVKCQETRSRAQNRKLARKWLEEKLDVLENGEESRLAVKTAAKAKKKASADKKKKRKYQKLADEKAANQEEKSESQPNKIEQESQQHENASS